MSTADSWDLRIPRDAAELRELWDEARRHGVEPGAHLRVVAAPAAATEPLEPTRSLSFIASFHAEPDLGRNADSHLQQGFGRE